MDKINLLCDRTSVRSYDLKSDIEPTVKWLNDPFVRKNFGINAAVSIDSHLQWLRDNPHIELFSILFDGQYCGNIVTDANMKHRSVYLQIYIGEASVRGCGAGYAAMKVICRHLFFTKNLNRIWLHTFEFNNAAKKLYEKLGFQIEGVEKEAILRDGVFEDQTRWSLLRKEWRE
ncbi:MAG TPA: GNAT family N-acetyltransferase [Candidatus Omnitrophota bacterium]|nr:GNAT family N-acetyltransferase [Candidatus Omnitrophota bacterium]